MIAELFGLQRRATPENPSFNLDSASDWAAFLGGSTADSGVQVNAQSALSVAAAWSVVSSIADDIACLPLHVLNRNQPEADKLDSVDRNNPAELLVSTAPNNEQDAFEFWSQFMVHALVWGNAYAFIDRNLKGEPMGLYPMLPNETALRREAGVLKYDVTVNGTRVTYDSQNVLHIKWVMIDNRSGMQALQQLREIIGLALAAQGFASKFFRHGVRSAGVLEIPLGMPKKAADDLIEGFYRYHEGPENWFKTIIARDGAKWHNNSISPNEGQMNETREQQVVEIARFFKFPVSRLGVKGSTSYNSKEADNRAYLDTCLRPWLARIAAECNQKLLSATKRSAGMHYFAHDTSELLRMDETARMQNYAVGIRSGMYSPNEARRWEGLPPRKGGDEYVPLSLQSQSHPKDATVPTGGADNPNPDGTEPKKGQPANPQRAELVYGIARTARYRAGKGIRSFNEFLRGELKSFRDEEQQLGLSGVVDSAMTRLTAAQKAILDDSTDSEDVAINKTVNAAMDAFVSEELGNV